MLKPISIILLFVLSGFSTAAISGQTKQVVCHKGQNITVASPAIGAHLGHGDSLEACIVIEEPTQEEEEEPGEGSDPVVVTMSSVVMMRCEGTIVDSLSTSDTEIVLPEEGDCAMVLADILDQGLDLISVNGGSGADAEGMQHLYTDYLLMGVFAIEEAEL
ncbi:MAG: hypothetical protein ACI9JM_000853 [Halioglobus sp.]|jgi:hypothetical protein